jgi:hypothetical protein
MLSSSKLTSKPPCGKTGTARARDNGLLGANSDMICVVLATHVHITASLQEDTM